MNKTLLVIAFSLIFYGLGSSVMAQTQTSPNYELRESYLGPGGSGDSQSSNYSSQDTVGDIGVGQSDSPNYQQVAGSNTTEDPRLAVAINTSSINFGALSTVAAATATSSFSVLNYTSYGYGVYVVGTPPDNGTDALDGMSATDASQVGVEQFGINLKANTSPVTFGAEATHTPDSTFGFGQASAGYNTTNNFRYVPGEKIAEANKSSGQTNFTISYIVNISANTPGGQYEGNQVLVVVGNY